MIIGIDEVGRGCWAGPLLVVAARAKKDLPDGLRDSKKLTKLQREKLFSLIQSSCDLGEGWVSAPEIDSLGLTQAMRLAVDRALVGLGGVDVNSSIAMDGSINYCDSKYLQVTCVPKADDLYTIVSAASIYAKVKRDQLMADAAKKYPNFGFERHVGYGTELHTAMLKAYGVTDLHRLSFKPIKAFL